MFFFFLRQRRVSSACLQQSIGLCGQRRTGRCGTPFAQPGAGALQPVAVCGRGRPHVRGQCGAAEAARFGSKRVATCATSLSARSPRMSCSTFRRGSRRRTKFNCSTFDCCSAWRVPRCRFFDAPFPSVECWTCWNDSIGIDCQQWTRQHWVLIRRGKHKPTNNQPPLKGFPILC